MNIDLTAYTENDPNVRLAVTADVVTITSLQRNEHGELYFDYGVDYFSDDFVHRTAADMAITTDNGHLHLWTLANDAAYVWKGTVTGDGILLNNKNGISMSHIYNVVQDQFRLVESDLGTVYSDKFTDAGYANPRWYEIYRVEGIPGPNGGGYLYADVYSDDTYETLVDSLQLNLHDTIDFRYHYAVMPRDDNWVYDWDGTVSDVDLGIVASARPAGGLMGFGGLGRR